MKLNRVLIAVSSSLLLISCASDQKQETAVAVQTTIPATTTTTLDLGDCSEFVDTRWEAESAKMYSALDSYKANKTAKNFDLFLDSLMEYRYFIRGLDVPFIKAEQDVWVFAFTDYYNALDLWWDTKGQYSYASAHIAFYDAYNDFRDKWNPLCDDDYPYPEDIIDGEPADSNYEPYEGYNDGIDQDCADIDKKVYVGDYDPDGLDGDGDGWGCE